MFQSKKRRGVGEASIGALVNSLVEDLVQQGQAADSDPVQNCFVLPDISVSKVQGVRAKKSLTYIQRAETTFDMYACVVGVQHLELYSFWLFKSQEQEAWLAAEVEKRPLIALTGDDSPVARALRGYARNLNQLPSDSNTLRHMSGFSAAV